MKEKTILEELQFRSDWKVQTFRWIIENRKVNTSENLPLLGANVHLGVTERFEGDGRAPASEDLSKYKKVEAGDIIMNPLGKPHGSIGRSSSSGITSPAYWVLRLNETENDSRFFHYLLRSEFMIKEFVRRSKNLPPNQFDLPWEYFREISIPIPPVQEQRKISDFLDRQIATVDALISLKLETQTLLVNASQAEFTKIFGHPFFASENNKASRRLGPCLLANDGGVWGDEPIGSGDSLVLRSTEISKRGYWRDLDAAAYRKLAEKEARNSRLMANDIVVTKASGSPDHIGKAALVTEEIEDLDASFGNFMQRIRVNPSIYLPEFLHYFLKSYNARSQFNFLGTTSTGLMNVSAEVLNNLRVPLIPVNEQRDTIYFLNEIEKDFASRLDLVEQSISTFVEFKNALIAAAVTGNFELNNGRNVA